MVKIEYVEWGLANRFDDGIELNSALKEDKELHDAILGHELGHKEENKFIDDLYHDLAPIPRLNQKDLVRFMVKHPKTLTQLLPIYYSKKRRKFIYDMNMLLIYSLFLMVLSISLFIFR